MTADEGDQVVVPTSAPGASAAKATRLAVGFGGAKKSSSPPSQPPQRQLDDKRSGDNRGDLRAVPAGTLVGMPGVTLAVDGPEGAATFRSSNRKLELKSGLQLMLRVDP